MDNFNGNVVYLQKEDFSSDGTLITPHDKPVVVMIMAGWCGFCKKAKPEFQKFADLKNGKDVYVAVIKTDGETESEKELGKMVNKICPNFRGFPTIIKIEKGKYTKTYEGPRTAEGLSNF